MNFCDEDVLSVILILGLSTQGSAQQSATGICFSNHTFLLTDKYASLSTGESKKLRYILQQLDGSIMRTDLGITAFYDDLEGMLCW